MKQEFLYYEPGRYVDSEQRCVACGRAMEVVVTKDPASTTGLRIVAYDHRCGDRNKTVLGKDAAAHQHDAVHEGKAGYGTRLGYYDEVTSE